MNDLIKSWERFEQLQRNSTEGRKGLEELIELLEARCETEKIYAKKLESIGNSSCAVANKGNIASAAQSYKMDCLNKSDQANVFADSLKSECVEPLRVILRQQNTSSKRLSQDGRKLCKEMRELNDKVQKAESKYLKDAKDAEEALTVLDYMNEYTNDNTSSSRKEQAKKRVNLTVNTLKKSEQDYRKGVDTANDFKGYYVQKMREITTEMEKIEHERLEVMRDSLRKFGIFVTSNEVSNKYDSKKIKENIEATDIEVDFKENFSNYRIEWDSINGYEFRAYESERYDILSPEPGAKKPYVRRLSVQRKYTDNESEKDPQYQIKHSELLKIVNLSWEGEKLTEEQKKNFAKIVKEKSGRQIFCKIMNKFRTSNIFQIGKEAFSRLVELFMKVLDEVMREMDVQAAMDCMILSQTYYTPNTSANELSQAQTFLQTGIVEHSLWKNFEFWEQAIFEGIKQEFEQQRKLGLNEGESASDREYRENITIFGQLASIEYTMLSFSLSKESVRDLIMKFCRSHKTSEDQIQSLMANIDDYGKVYEKKEKPKAPQRGVPEWIAQLEASEMVVKPQERTTADSVLEVFVGLGPRKSSVQTLKQNQHPTSTTEPNTQESLQSVESPKEEKKDIFEGFEKVGSETN